MTNSKFFSSVTWKIVHITVIWMSLDNDQCGQKCSLMLDHLYLLLRMNYLRAMNPGLLRMRFAARSPLSLLSP